MGFYGGGGFSGNGSGGRQDPEDQFDIPQAYIDVAFPVGNEQYAEPVDHSTAVERRTEKTTGETVSTTNCTVEQPSPTMRVRHRSSRPINLALKSYGEASFHNVVPEEAEMDDRTKAINFTMLDKLLKRLQKNLVKGRTEVELILKFQITLVAKINDVCYII